MTGNPNAFEELIIEAESTGCRLSLQQDEAALP